LSKYIVIFVWLLIRKLVFRNTLHFSCTKAFLNSMFITKPFQELPLYMLLILIVWKLNKKHLTNCNMV